MQKNLEQQIKNTCFWAFGGFFWYLVISFFLLSDYPIQEQTFNHKKAYEVIKDALGLVAAFVAPAIAVILFRDWREEHALIKNEEISLEVRSLLESTYNNMTTLPRVYDDKQFPEAIRRHFQYMMALDRLEKNINLHDDLSSDYVKKLKNINQFNYECAINIQRFYFQSKDESSKADTLKMSLQNIDNAKKFKDLSDDLKPLTVHSN